MITAKFGGTAITPRNLHYVRQIVNDNYGYVVVSAIGKEYDSDVKVTDLLDGYYRTGNVDLWNKVCDKYRRLVEFNGIDINLQQLLDKCYNVARNCGYGYCLSLGERLSAMCVAKYLGVGYTEAQDVVFFRQNNVNYRKTYKSLRQHYHGKTTVIGGFYGFDGANVVTFPRGGSDVTGSLCAVATNSTLYENWTDVNGVCIVNPNVLPNARTISDLSYRQMYYLAKGGAQVLHPLAVKPLQKFGIPLRIANYANRTSSTLVSDYPSNMPIIALTESRHNGKVITTILFGDKLSATEKVFAFCKHYNDVNIIDRTSTTNVICNYSVDNCKNSPVSTLDNLPTVKIVKVSKTAIILQSPYSILRCLYQFVD